MTPLLSLESCKTFFNLQQPQYIDWDFYQPYLEIEPPFGELGVVVYLRTYSRFIPELNRREKFAETCLRVVEYSLSLDTVSSLDSKKEEAKLLFDCLFNLRGFAAGRSYWIANTAITKYDSSANWNCTLRLIDSISSFSEIFYWLLLGAGTGFNIEDTTVANLPKLYPATIKHDDYNYLGKDESKSNTELIVSWYNEIDEMSLRTYTKEDLILNDKDFIATIDSGNTFDIYVGDSKEGWCNALRLYLSILTFSQSKHITFIYDNVRPAGTRIKTFGGRASGHQALQKMFNKIASFLTINNYKLTPICCLDIANCIGEGVVSGGTRRTAMIGLFSPENKELVDAKVNLFTDPNKSIYSATRVLSNNSMLYYERPSYEKLSQDIEQIKQIGDPGFWIIGNSQKLANSPVKGCNPSIINQAA